MLYFPERPKMYEFIHKSSMKSAPESDFLKIKGFCPGGGNSDPAQFVIAY